MSQKVAKEATKVFSKTINSPKTAFPMYANPATREKAYLKKCTSGRTNDVNAFNLIELYLKQLKAPLSPNTRTWITHDGPPYANGNLHMGHFENKVILLFHHLML